MEVVAIGRLNDSVVTLRLIVSGEIRVSLPHLREGLKLSGVDGNGGLNDGPLNSFSARRSGQGSVVLPVRGHIKTSQEIFDSHSRGSSLIVLVLNALDVHCFEEGDVSCGFIQFEEDSNYGSESVIVAGIIVDHMELHGVVLAVDGVLGGGVEVELSWVEIFLSTGVEVELERALVDVVHNDCVAIVHGRKRFIVLVRVSVDFHIFSFLGTGFGQVDGRLLGSSSADFESGNSAPVGACFSVTPFSSHDVGSNKSEGGGGSKHLLFSFN